MRRIVELHVDPIACDGRGLCAELLPELIKLDDWGFPIIRKGAVPEALVSEAEETVRLCPKLALRLCAMPGAPAAGRRVSDPSAANPGAPRSRGGAIAAAEAWEEAASPVLHTGGRDGSGCEAVRRVEAPAAPQELMGGNPTLRSSDLGSTLASPTAIHTPTRRASRRPRRTRVPT
jgi:ferredoxin